MAENTLREKLRNAFSFREDNHARLGLFLRRGHLPARLANFAFNAVCKAARDVRRVTRRQERPPAQAGVCALIAELSLPQCLHYRVRERAAQLEHLGWKVRTCDWLDYESATLALQLADCALFYRVSMIRHVPALYAEARRLGLPILYDIDDLIFLEEDLAAHLAPMRLPPELAARMLEFAPKIREAMEAADVRLVSTLGLKKRVDSMLQPETARSGDGPGRKCFVVHNSIADELAAMARELPARTGSDNEIRMFYGSGSDTHGADFMLIADALRQAMEKDARLHLHLHGPLELPPGFESCAGRVHCVPFLDKDIYYRIMADYDIALMPLVQDVFNDGKSDIKYQEASLFGIPSIASSSAEFLASITDGVDGLIAAAPEEWRDKILQLASSPALRAAMGQRARSNVLARYARAAIAERELAPALPPQKKTAGKRLLLVNAVFGHDAADGAAAVVENTAMALCGQGFEVFVFSADLADGMPQGRLARRKQHGVTVISAAVRPDFAAYDNEEVEGLFHQVLWAVQPDLVHFHCIQGMGDLAGECLRSGVPYVVTMHHRWWVCPRPFMLDASGNYCARQTVDPEVCRRRCGLADEKGYRRRIRMEETVGRARAVFTPSDFQAAVVRRHFPRCSVVRANRNGILLPRASRPSRPEGPLRLGYLGGKARHRGYFFLAKALRGLQRDDFELIFADPGLARGEGGMTGAEDEALWEGLRRRILPLTRRQDMDGLYAHMDVLLFPSLAAESFGLSVREALARDVFVLSSDCGGPREAIIYGENGLLFPMGDLESFREHLRDILQNQNRFKNYRTANYGDMRGIEDQAKELAAAYEEILRQ